MEDVPDWWERSVGTRAKEIWLPSDQEKSSLVLSKRLEAKSWFTLNNAIEALSKTHTSQSTLVTSDEEKTPNSLMKVRLYPTKLQTKLLNKMLGTHRTIYNKLVECSREDCRKLKTSELTAKYRPISQKQSLTDYLPEYLLEVPEGVMDSTFRDYTKALKSSMALFKALKKKDKKTSFPELKFKSKKHNSSSIELRDEKFYLCIPRTQEFEQTSSSRVCAIDPGVRSFITIDLQKMPDNRQSSIKENQGDFKTQTLSYEQESVQDVLAREGHDRRHASEDIKLAFEELQRSLTSFIQDIRHDIQAKKNFKQDIESNADVVSLQVQDDAGVQDEEVRRKDG